MDIEVERFTTITYTNPCKATIRRPILLENKLCFLLISLCIIPMELLLHLLIFYTGNSTPRGFSPFIFEGFPNISGVDCLLLIYCWNSYSTMTVRSARPTASWKTTCNIHMPDISSYKITLLIPCFPIAYLIGSSDTSLLRPQ